MRSMRLCDCACLQSSFPASRDMDHSVGTETQLSVEGQSETSQLRQLPTPSSLAEQQHQCSLCEPFTTAKPQYNGERIKNLPHSPRNRNHLPRHLLPSRSTRNIIDINDEFFKQRHQTRTRIELTIKIRTPRLPLPKPPMSSTRIHSTHPLHKSVNDIHRKFPK